MQSPSKDDQEKKFDPERRKFLKISAAAGAGAAAVAVVGPSLISHLDSSTKGQVQKGAPVATTLASNSGVKSGEPMIIVVRNGSLNILQGRRGLVLKDSELASKIASEVRSKIAL
jgi:TAT (twin-arginine translocation) pathway signal sequence